MYQKRVTSKPRSVDLNHVVHTGAVAIHDNIQRSFRILIGQRESVAGGLRAQLVRRLARIDQVFHFALLDNRHALAGNSLSVKGSAGLQGMENIVAEVDVIAEHFLAHAAGQATALLVHGHVR